MKSLFANVEVVKGYVCLRLCPIMVMIWNPLIDFFFFYLRKEVEDFSRICGGTFLLTS